MYEVDITICNVCDLQISLLCFTCIVTKYSILPIALLMLEANTVYFLELYKSYKSGLVFWPMTMRFLLTVDFFFFC